MLSILNNRQLLRPYLTIALVMVLLLGTSGVIIYFQRTLLQIEEALPITLSKQERDIRVLVNDMGTLVQSLGFARAEQSPKTFRVALRQTLEIEKSLEQIRENNRFDDVLGVSAIYAKLNPAIFDIKNWLSDGLFNFEPTSAQTMKLAENRAKLAYQEAEVLLKQVSETAIDVLTEQSQRIDNFRSIMIITLTALAVMAIGLVILGFRLQNTVFALKESEEQIRYRANYDSLTHLPNRLNFTEHLSEAISRSRRDPGQVALLFIDLDRFKTINDTLGHDFGDELIKQVATRIRHAVRETDVVSRLGGDEFTVLLPNMTDGIHASIIAKSILEQLSRSFQLFGHEVYSGASIGITVSPQDGADAMTLLKNADMAMYEAKDRGRNTFRFFTSKMTERSRQFLELDKEMRRALIKDELQIHYQPIFNLSEQSLVGVEALLRWQHPSKGLILPEDFINVAEETGLIEDIGLWVLRRACNQGVAWLDNGLHPNFYLAINISMRQFKGGFDSRQVAEVLDETGFPADKLLLEITETLLMDEDVRIREVLAEFREMGVRLAVDDFGTGYSALSYLREFPVNTLKIDRSFIQDIGASRSSRRLVETIITMAHGLDLVTIAEGVENSEQGDLLAELNCDMAQGYHYCNPVAADKISRLTKADKPRMTVVGSS